METEEGAARFLIDHGENIVNILGAEINNIEATIKVSVPFDEMRRLISFSKALSFFFSFSERVSNCEAH